MNKVIMFVNLASEWLIFPIAFPIWRAWCRRQDGFANDYLFYHLCIYAEITGVGIRESTEKSYDNLVARPRTKMQQGDKK